MSRPEWFKSSVGRNQHLLKANDTTNINAATWPHWVCHQDQTKGGCKHLRSWDRARMTGLIGLIGLTGLTGCSKLLEQNGAKDQASCTVLDLSASDCTGPAYLMLHYASWTPNNSDSAKCKKSGHLLPSQTDWVGIDLMAQLCVQSPFHLAAWPPSSSWLNQETCFTTCVHGFEASWKLEKFWFFWSLTSFQDPNLGGDFPWFP